MVTKDQRYRVLAVDDNQDALDLIRSTLEDQYDVMTLSNPVDLYELMDLYEPDLLLLDIMMPRITGYQLIEILRKNPSTRELPIIVLSAKSNASEIKHGYRLGATLYLPKPFQPDRLLKNLETQFKMHPPLLRRKALSIEEVRQQLEQKPGYRKGEVMLTGERPDSKEIKYLDIRKRMQEKMMARQQEARKGREKSEG